MAYTPYHADWKDSPDASTPITATALEWIEAGIVASALVADNAATSAASGVSAYNQAPRSAAITSLTAWDVPVWNGSSWVRPSGTASAATFLRGDGAWALPVSAATALPSSPADGQEAILVDSLTAPTYQWRFRYNAGSSSSYKWEFVGGIPALVSAAGQVALSGTGMSDAADDLPIFVCPRAGYYHVVCACSVQPTNGSYVKTGVHNASVSGSVFGSGQAWLPGGEWERMTVEAQGLVEGAGNTIRQLFQVTTAGGGLVQDRTMSILPVRVS